MVNKKRNTNWSFVGVLEGPFFGDFLPVLFALEPHLVDLFVKGIFEIWLAQQRLNWDQYLWYKRALYRADLKSGTPLVLQNIKTDASNAVDVRVEDFSPEEHLGWRHGIVGWKEEFSLEHAPCAHSSSYLRKVSLQVQRSWPWNVWSLLHQEPRKFPPLLISEWLTWLS